MDDNNWTMAPRWEFTDASLGLVVDDHSPTWEKELVLSITDSDGERETVHLSVLNNVMALC